MEEFTGGFTKVSEGCLFVNKEPVYIIELIKEPDGMEYVTIYAVQKGSYNQSVEGKAIPKRASGVVEKVIGRVSNNTLLGSLANRYNKTKKVITRKEAPPLFMTEVTEGVDTFTKEQARGFYEREKDSFAQRDGKGYVKHGEITGVFISLNNIVWYKEYILIGDILEEYTARKGVFLGF